MPAEPKSYHPLSELSAVLPFYAVYIFLSGWAFDDFYFRSFGLDPKLLDLNFHDTLVKGFTIAFGGSWWLLIPYALLLIPLFLSSVAWSPRSKLLLTVMAGVVLLLAVYFLSRHAGEVAARIDKGDKSTLPDIAFVAGKQQLIGKLLYVHSDQYFIHAVRKQGQEKGGERQLSIFRGSQMDEVTITEHE
jgi:hypothetical protein